jgi:hypothetical protein
MQQLFSSQDSVFLKHFFKVVDEKGFDRVNFQKYWLIMTGKDAGLLRKFYDNTLMYYDKFLKALSARDSKIRSNKQKVGIEVPSEKEDMILTSFINPIPDRYVEKIINSYLHGYEMRGGRSYSNAEDKPVKMTCITSSLCSKEEKKIEEECSEAGEDRDTQD